MSYLIKKNKQTNQITYMEYNLQGYEFTPKSKENAKLTINKILIVNPCMIEQILTIKFNAMYKKLLTFIYQASNEDDDSSSLYALSEIDRLKGILFHKYQKYISQKKQQVFMERLVLLEQQLKMQMMKHYNSYNDQLISTYNSEYEKTSGRSR